METLALTFFVQVDPCPITDFIAVVEFDEISYNVGDGIIRS
jgi:hypothetical protein